MTGPSNEPRSFIPRPSRLPVPRSGLRSSPSSEALKPSSAGGLVVPRLRPHTSRDKLSLASNGTRDRNAETRSHGTLRTSLNVVESYDDFAARTVPGTRRTLQEEKTRSAEDGRLENTRKPSLLERTVETLSHVPPSPGGRSTASRSSVKDTPRSPSNLSRPGSSHLNDVPPLGLSGSRPSSSGSPPFNDRYGSAVGGYQTPLSSRGSGQSFGSQGQQSPTHIRSPPQPMKPNPPSARALKPRPSLNRLTRQPPRQSLGDEEEAGRKRPSLTPVLPSASEEPTPRKSSQALRDQIAQARAAKRAQMKSTQPVFQAEDPFNQAPDRGSQKEVMRRKIASARSDGRLNIAAMGLKEIPDEVMSMYSLDALNGGSWAECVDLTRFVAADNGIEVVREDMFPDVAPQAFDDSDEMPGTQFGGLEVFDLHGNMLRAVPSGLRRLQLLTSLNLSNNRLDNSCLEIICQIQTLRDLRLADNAFQDRLDDDISKLSHLEVLELQRNRLTQLPTMSGMAQLRLLNVSQNQFQSLPFESLQNLPLVEILASKNKLSGVLVQGDVGFSRLQTLDVMSNALTSISSGELTLPALQHFDCSYNRLTALPNVASWSSLVTILAGDNSISELPAGFTALSSLKTADFTGNNITILGNSIGLMESLDVFRIAANPLRERKFAGMTTDELKKALKGRLSPEPDASDADSIYGTPSASPTGSEWSVKTGGVLDRSRTESSSLNPVKVANIASSHAIQSLILHHNSFDQIPESVAFFANTLTALNLSNNNLVSDTYLREPLELPVLQELNLSSNKFSSLNPLRQRLVAPQLNKLDISFNRLSCLPELRSSFPVLTVLLASNNTIGEVQPEVIKGFRVVDLCDNELASLNARIGLLGGPGGLERLEVKGNRFRVPKYTILEKGTQATLAWLRDRIPVDEMPADSV